MKIDLSKFDNAIEKCELKEFVQNQPNGVNEIISEDGKNISGTSKEYLLQELYEDKF